MNVLKRQMFTDLAHKLWDFSDDDNYPITEVYELDHSPCDKYARVGLWMYLNSDAEDYYNIRIYISKSDDFGIIEEINAYRLDGYLIRYYWICRDNKLYTSFEFELLERYGITEEYK